MSEKDMQNKINEYLKEVKSKLPEWLKEKKEDKEILAELEEHIWSKAEELSETDQPTIESVKIAISHMGAPDTIAKEYKRRGTPKVYITEEMWPLYLKVIAVVFGVIVGIVFITQIIEFIFGNFNSILNAISGLQIGLLAAFIVITIVFVVLSMEGYFPEDFKSEKSREKVKQQQRIIMKKGTPVSDLKEKPLKPFIKPAGEIIGGSFAIVMGFLLLLQPFPIITILIDSDFLLYLKFAGVFILVEGILDLSRGLIGNRQAYKHQIVHGITIAVKFASISVVILMMLRPEIFPIIIFENPTKSLTNIGIASQYYNLFRLIAGVIIAVVALSTIENFNNIFKLEKYKN